MIDYEEINLSEEQKREALLPTNDLLFKRIYGKEGSEKITEDFIKAFLGLDVTIEKLQDSKALDINYIDKKAGVLDVLVTNKDGTKINLEMQVGHYTNVEERFCFYGFELFTEQFQKGLQYNEAKKTIGVLILKDDYSKYKGCEDYILSWKLREEKYHDLILTDKLELCIISLEKIKKKVALGEISDKDQIAIWTKFLLNPKELKEEDMNENKEVKEAYDKYNEMIDDVEVRRAAFKRQLDIMEKHAAKQDGINEGKEEAQKQIAKKLLDRGMSIDEIMEITDLTKEEIEDLKC